MPSDKKSIPNCKNCGKPMRQVGSKAPYTCWTCDCKEGQDVEAGTRGSSSGHSLRSVDSGGSGDRGMAMEKSPAVMPELVRDYLNKYGAVTEGVGAAPTDLQAAAKEWRQINWYGSDGEQVDKALCAFVKHWERVAPPAMTAEPTINDAARLIRKLGECEGIRVGLEEVSIAGIWLRREGDDVVVGVERKLADGRFYWFEIIREHMDGQFSHIVEPSKIQGLFWAAPSDTEVK